MKVFTRQNLNKVFFILATSITFLPFQNCSPAKLGQSQLSVEKSQSISPSIPRTPTAGRPPVNTPAPTPAAPAPVAPAPVAPAPIVQPPATPAPVVLNQSACEMFEEKLGTAKLQSPYLRTLSTESLIVLEFYAFIPLRSDPFYLVRFAMQNSGFSIKIFDGTTVIAVPESAIGQTSDSSEPNLASIGQDKLKFRFELARIPDFASISSGTQRVEIFCKDRLIGSATTGLQDHFNPAGAANGCKNLGTPIDGKCHFMSSCKGQVEARNLMQFMAFPQHGYFSCKDKAPEQHPDCVKAFGEERGYVVSCPLINMQEAAKSSTISTEMPTEIKVETLYSTLRKRLPDSEARAFWTAEIDRSPSRLQDLETLLRQP